jgi:hypothetical protein
MPKKQCPTKGAFFDTCGYGQDDTRPCPVHRSFRRVLPLSFGHLPYQCAQRSLNRPEKTADHRELCGTPQVFLTQVQPGSLVDLVLILCGKAAAHARIQWPTLKSRLSNVRYALAIRNDLIWIKYKFFPACQSIETDIYDGIIMRLTIRTNLASRILMACAVNGGHTVRTSEIAEIAQPSLPSQQGWF